MRKRISLLVIIAVAGLIVLAPSFKLSFVGDDWLAFYRFRYQLGDWSHHDFNYLTYFLTPYGAQDMTMGILQKVFGYTSYYYFVISFIFRFGSCVALFWFIDKFTRNTLASFFAALFFMLTSIGLDATNWVFNMPSYISLILLLGFIYCLIESQIKKSIRFSLLSILFAYLAFVIAPIRMHGLPLIAAALEVFLIIKNRNWPTLKFVGLRLVLLLAVFWVIKHTGQTMGVGGLEELVKGLKLMQETTGKGDLTFLLTPLVIIGRFFVPETFWSLVSSYFPNPTLRHILPFAIVFFSPLAVYFAQLETEIFKSKKYSLILLSALFACTIATYLIIKTNTSTIIIPEIIGPALIGAYFLIFGIVMTLRYLKENISFVIYLSVFWTLLSFLYPYLLAPFSYFGTTHRYFIVPALGIALFWGILVSLAKNTSLRIYIAVVFTIFLSMQIYFTHSYLTDLTLVRSSKLANSIWSLLPNIPNLGTGKEPKVFYFEGDSAIIYHSITFGFPPHMAMLYNYNETQAKLPVPLSSWDDIVTTVTTGKNMPAYGYPIKPISIDSIYAYRVTSDTVKDVTLEKRQILRSFILGHNTQTTP